MTDIVRPKVYTIAPERAFLATLADGLLAMTAGGGLLIAVAPSSRPGAGWGALAVVVATLAWAADNAVGRPLADRDPTRVVLAKGALGAATSAALAVAFGEAPPALGAMAALTLCGA